MLCWFFASLYTAEATRLTCLKGLTEPNHGSDPAGMDTTAEETDGGFLLHGSKTWITNAPVA
jgi:glutaryl-CoA dehydrogenase